MFQSLAGSPSTSHVERLTDSLNALIVSIPGGKPLHEPRRLATMHHRHDTSFQSQAGSPSTSHCVRVGPSSGIVSVSIPGGKPLHEPHCSSFFVHCSCHRFQSLAGSPSTSHGIALSEDEQLRFVSIPGGKPLHEPLGVTVRTPKQRSVSIPGGKPLHEPHDLREASNRSTSLFQSLAGSPSTSHFVLQRPLQDPYYGFNPWREAPPRATPACQYSQRQTPEFQSQAGSPSTSHHVRQQVRLITIVVSIPGGKPLHEPPIRRISMMS